MRPITIMYLSVRPRLLLISYRFPPESYPLAIGLKGVVEHLRRDWKIDVVTAAESAFEPEGVHIHHVPSRSTQWLHRLLGPLRLGKIAKLLTWPDPFWPWIQPALETAERIARERKPDVALVFMMPFSTGFVGTRLKARTGLSIVLNLNDSPTCSDMNPSYPSWAHYRLSQWMENHFVRTADRTIYVSRHNRNRIRDRQPSELRDKLRLVRCSAEPPPPITAERSKEDAPFRVVYTGAMNGWHDLDASTPSFVKRAYRAWQQFGVFTQTPLDHRSHSPVYIGQALKQIVDTHPDWKGKIRLDVYGNTFPQDMVNRVLERFNLADIVHVHGRIPHDEVYRRTQEADLLFLTLPDRLDESAGGRISLKTYEYLMTDRPILAAVPDGENCTFLEDKPGTFITDPKDVGAMADIIRSLASTRFQGQRVAFERPDLRESLSSQARAEAISDILHEVAAPEVKHARDRTLA